MTTVAIISEYNPFHNGHLYQINEIRKEFGKDTAIVAIMSGNFTQRGDVAIADKLTRATAAVTSGVNLVLELPFPYSISSADYFAKSGVAIANALGEIDYLSFGSESGKLDDIIKTAEIMLSPKYSEEFKKLSADKALGYAKLCELAYKSCLTDGEGALEFTPNNILAVEYTKALLASGSKIKPHTVKRLGQGYNDSQNSASKHPSAMAIRQIIQTDGFTKDVFSAIPEESHNIINSAIEVGSIPCNSDKISSAVISKLRLSGPCASFDIHDAEDGLYNRLINSSYEANDINTLLKLSETKKFTNARLRRAMWYGFFGVTSSDVTTPPKYTQVLAMDKVGMSRLKVFGKDDGFFVLTKPSDYSHFSEIAKSQKELCDSADSVFELTRPVPQSGKTPLKLTPYVKK